MPLQSSTYDASAHLIYHYQYTDGSPMSVCPVSPQPAIVNPYTTGFLGNYRPYQTKVFQQTRSYGLSTNLNSPVVDVKNAGFINDFYAYWYFNSGSWTANPNGTRWVTANTVNLYDKYGQQLENKDALGRFSAAKFDFNGELPSAVASNAMNREIYAASLEDNRFVPGSSADADICNIREFIQPSNKLSLKQLAVNTISHSGNYSALLPGEGVTMATIFHTLKQKENPYLMLDAQKQYITQTTAGLYPNGFEPYTGHQYIFNAWVNDASPNDRTVNLVLSINGQNVGLRCKAVVEGWKLIEGTMDLSTVAGATALNIAIVPSLGKTIYIDDIRMHPFDAHMKTYAYDDKTMRLMAEIDENGFATFYEYDDEGLLIRVKKETEKGIMTLKESRSTYRFNNTP
jgi:YD repeat-containing protein